MSKQGKSRKSLLVGIIAAVVILAVLLVLVLTQCTGSQEGTSDPTIQTTESSTSVENADLYWNVDRAEYDGKSEGGMSSRRMESDGYYHVRFFKDGEMIELRVAEKTLINRIDTKDLMGLEFDEDGIVVGYIAIEDMPVEKVGWKFYVQSVASGGKVVKVNSSDKFNGMEIVLDLSKGTKVYDMTGTAGEIGCEAQAVQNDRVMGVADKNGNLLAVYIYDRSNMQIKFQAHCQHCDEEVTWIKWDKENALPTTEGHYQLSGNVQLKGQQNLAADAKVCVDLNGFTVDAASGKRAYSMHNMNCELAIMDTSEAQTGRIAAHGESENQGLCIWVRYGACYLYGGTLDASDAITTNAGGAAVYIAAERWFYMNGGQIIGGTAKYRLNEKTGAYTNGLGGSVYTKGKFVLNDGVIRDGIAQSVAVWKNGKTTYQRGNGGNIFIASGGVFEMNGGTIKNGRAGTGGNVFLDGTGEFIMNDGIIYGGRATDPGRNAGNVYINSKTTFTLNGGSILAGSSKNLSGNVHLAGTLTMNGGVIADGKILDATTGAQKTGSKYANMYIGNGAKFYMYGGHINGSVSAIDSNADDGKHTTVLLSGYATIDGAPEGTPNLTLMTGKEKVVFRVGNMLKGSMVGVTASGVFSLETKEENVAHFRSDVADADVVYVDNCLAMGKMACLCGSTTETHMGACDGTKLMWGSWNETSSLPSVTGNYYLTSDVSLTKQQGLGTENGGEVINLNLNGHTVESNQRVALIYGTVNLVDHVGGGQMIGMGPTNGKDHTGTLLLYKGSALNIYAGTLKLSDEHYNLTNGGVLSVAAGAQVTMYGGTIDGRNTSENTVSLGGAVRLHGTMTVHGGEIYGGKADRGGSFYIERTGKLVLSGGTITGGESKNEGGSIYITGVDASFTMNGGQLVGGNAGKDGGAIRMLGSTTVTLNGGTISGCKAGGVGGSISVASGVLNITGGQLLNGASTGNGGNICLNGGTLNLSGGTISGGTVKGKSDNHTANIFVNNAVANVSGGTVKGGFLVMNSNSKNQAAITLSGSPVITREETYGLRLYASGTGTVEPDLTIVGTLGEGACVAINATNVFTGTTVKENTDKFVAPAGEQVAFSMDACLFLSAPKCLCSAAVGENSDSITHAEWCDQEMRVWQPWNGTGTLTESGSYYLTGNVTDGANQKLVGLEIALDLAGFTYEAASRAFQLSENAELYIVDSSVEKTGVLSGKGEADKAGGVISNGGSKVYLCGGTIKLADGHNVISEGGVIAVGGKQGELHIYDGCTVGSTTASGTVANGGAIRLQTGKVYVHGGNVIGQDVTENGGAIYVKSGELTVGGKANIGEVYLTVDATMAVAEDLDASAASVTVSMEEPGVFAENVQTDVSAAFHAADLSYEVKYVDSTLQLLEKQNHTHCFCIGAEVLPEGHTCVESQIWTPIEKGTSVTLKTGGYYYLNWSGESAQKITINTNEPVYLCLNGASIRAGTVIVLGENATLVICDCSTEQTGILTTTKLSPIQVNEGNTVQLMSGTISGTYGTKNTSRVSVLVSGGSFEMYGGKVVNGCSNIDNVTDEEKKDTTIGGNIHMTGGTVAIYGGTVSGGKFENADRDITVEGGSLTVGGKTEIGVLYLPEGRTITVKEKDLEASVGILMAKPGDPIAPVTTNVSDSFTSIDTNYVVGLKGGNLVLGTLTENGHQHCFCEGAEALPEGHPCDTFVSWQPVSASATLDSGYYYLDLSGGKKAMSITVNPGQHVYLCLNGCEMYARKAIVLGSGSTISICDCSEGQTGVIHPSASGSSTPIILDGEMTVNLYGGSISGSEILTTVTMSNAAAQFNMYGGKILNGKNASAHGGNVTISNGTFNLYGGTISGGQATASNKHGGNIYISNGTFNMSGGTITGGKAAGKGGNVMLLSGKNKTAVFNMTGGSILGGLTQGVNAANGGNICVNMLDGSTRCAFIATGGTISGGKASGDGGNVYINGARDELTLIDCSVVDGSAVRGADAYVKAGVVTVGGGVRIGEVYLVTNRVITVSAEKALAQTASIGVTVDAAPAAGESVTIATGAANADAFSTEMTGCKIDYVDGNVVLLAQ